MSERSRLPVSLKWRAFGWMEMGLSRADAARRLNVSRSVVHRLWNKYQTESSVSRRHVPDHSVTSGRRISASTVQSRVHNSSLYARFTLESDSGRLLIWRERSTRDHQSNTVERHSYRGGGIMVWAGISLGGHTDLHVFQGGIQTGVRYRNEILDVYVHLNADANGNNFMMDDNAQPQRAVIVEEYFEGLGLE
ncbi:transposable element Tcb2 transposase [Trichonephila clavipes]|nr:transposable element Tcb2 transposase [Trichonephila clavipes]